MYVEGSKVKNVYIQYHIIEKKNVIGSYNDDLHIIKADIKAVYDVIKDLEIFVKELY